MKPAVVTYKGGVYTVQITLGNAAAIKGVLIGKKEAKQITSDGVVTTYEVELDSLDDTTITMSAFFGSPEGPLGFDTANAKDTSAPTPSVPDPYESSYQVYYKGSDASQQYVGKSFQSKVKVVPQADGSYIVELTANSLGNAGKLADVKVAGEAVAYTDNADGSRTYEIPMSDLKATLDFTFGYTISFGNQSRTMEHPFQLVLDGAEYAGPTATTSFLVEQIAKAKSELAAGEKKPQAAKDALQKAIDDAQAVADDANATDRERGDAMKAVVDATAAFKATPDVTVADPYESDYQIYYKGSDATADYVGRSFQSKVKVVPQADGTAVVELTANSLGNAGKLADVKVDGTAVAYTDNLDGSRTYEIPVADVKGTTDFTFGYTVSFNGQSRTMEHPFQLVLAGGAYTGYTATVEFLNAQITSAEGTLAAGEKKPQAAKDALQKAIDDAKAVAAKADATPAERGDAVKALDAAVKAFKATADEEEKPTEGLELGKTYDVSYKLYKTGTTESSMASGMFVSPAEVKRMDDGYRVRLTTAVEAGKLLQAVTFGSDDATATAYTDADGNVVYEFTVASIDKAIDLGFTYDTGSAGMGVMTHHADLVLDASTAKEAAESELTPVTPDQTEVDKSKLTSAIAEAKKLAQGNKTEDAYKALQSAIAAAQKVADDESADQAAVDKAVETLNAAVKAFKDSADKPSDKTMVAGKEYTVAAQLQKEDGSASMAADFFEKTATVVWDGAKSYKVTFTVTADGVQYIKGIVGKDATVTDLGGGKYAVTVESLANRIALTFSLSVPGIQSMEQTGYLWLDTASLPGLPEQQKPETKPETKPNTNPNPKGDENEEGFQVGHTYQVPIAFKKLGSSETSMAAQYFGDTALVRPQSDGTFKVSFSTNKPEWISALTFNGATVTRNGSEYTLTIPAATADQVLQLGLTIKPMGDKAVTTDLHLYLSQAKDLGTGKDGVTSSSDKVLPQTGDAQQAVIAGTAVAGIAAIAAAEAIRRRKRAE